MRSLERQGHSPAVAEDGPAALRMAKDQKPDVVLLDLRIPGTSGKLLYGKMLEHEPQLGSRVIVLSGESQSSEDAAWFAAQGLPVIPKPFELEGLFATIERVGSREHT